MAIFIIPAGKFAGDVVSEDGLTVLLIVIALIWIFNKATQKSEGAVQGARFALGFTGAALLIIAAVAVAIIVLGS